MVETCEDKVYSKICQPRFDKLDKNQGEILDCLKGTLKAPGLCDEVRGFRKTIQIVKGAVAFIMSVIFVQFVIWIKEKFFGA